MEVLVTIDVWLTLEILASASPLNPRVDIHSKSSRLDILLVACGKKALIISSRSIPLPLSLILIKSIPPLAISILILSAPASSELSKSSFTMEKDFLPLPQQKYG